MFTCFCRATTTVFSSYGTDTLLFFLFFFSVPCFVIDINLMKLCFDYKIIKAWYTSVSCAKETRKESAVARRNFQRKLATNLEQKQMQTTVTVTFCLQHAQEKIIKVLLTSQTEHQKTSRKSPSTCHPPTTRPSPIKQNIKRHVDPLKKKKKKKKKSYPLHPHPLVYFKSHKNLSWTIPTAKFSFLYITKNMPHPLLKPPEHPPYPIHHPQCSCQNEKHMLSNKLLYRSFEDQTIRYAPTLNRFFFLHQMLILFSHRQHQMNIAHVCHFCLLIERHCIDSYRASIRFLLRNAVIKEQFDWQIFGDSFFGDFQISSNDFQHCFHF